jgi:polyphenol oxidase
MAPAPTWATGRLACDRGRVSSAGPERPAAVELIWEQPLEAGGMQLHAQPAWLSRLPWVTQGTTSGADLSLFGSSPAGDVVQGWRDLGRDLGFRSLIHARQVHGSRVLLHRNAPEGLLIAGDADGHMTNMAGVLLAISVADCVPIFLVAPAQRAVAVLHSGWRSAAAGILERGIELLAGTFQAERASLLMHLGPAICGDCFEVGAEVPDRLGLSVAGGPTARFNVDLRALLAHRAIEGGLRPQNISISGHCTRCGSSPFFSHRAGCGERQIAVIAAGIDGA